MAQVFKKGGVALITGGASGIGLALAKKCQGHGMRVLIADKNAEALALAKESLGDVTALEADVSWVEDWQSLRAVVERDFGGRSDRTLNPVWLVANVVQAGLTFWPSMPGGGASARGTTPRRSRLSTRRTSWA